jgi:hypothetical protein
VSSNVLVLRLYDVSPRLIRHPQAIAKDGICSQGNEQIAIKKIPFQWRNRYERRNSRISTKMLK